MIENSLDDNTKVTYTITSNGAQLVDKSEVKEVIATNKKLTKEEKKNNKEKWNELERMVSNYKDATGGSTPPDTGTTVITNPDLYESGYTSKSSTNVTGYDLSYDTTGKFSQSDNCAPVAADNLTYYYYKNKGYSNLWTPTTTYNRFYTLMKTNVGRIGTSLYDGFVLTSSLYIRIADGWNGGATRFVWTNCSGDWDMVTVHPSF